MHRMYITLFRPLVRYRNIKGWRTWTRLVGFVVPLIVVSVLCGSSPSNWLFGSHYYPWTWSSVYYPPSSANISIAPAEEGLEFRPGVAGDGEREADPHVTGPKLSTSVPELFKNSIRALCNANTSEGFQPSKDVSIPEINLPGGRTDGLIGGPSPSKRPILAFFAGRLYGPIRPILLQHWKNKDPEIQVFPSLPKNVTYYGMMRKSKYCICPSGYEVASQRMVESLYTGCVPVIIKEGSELEEVLGGGPG